MREHTIQVDGLEIRVRPHVEAGRRGPRHAAELIAPSGERAIVDAASEEELEDLLEEAAACFAAAGRTRAG